MKKRPDKQKNDELAARSIALHNASGGRQMALRELLKKGSCFWVLASGAKFLSAKSEKDVRELRDTIGRQKGKKLAQILKNKYKKRQENGR